MKVIYHSCSANIWSYDMQYFVPLLTILFIGLKLTGYIAWSWVWVLSPLWIGLSIVLVIWIGALAVIFKYGKS